MMTNISDHFLPSIPRSRETRKPLKFVFSSIGVLPPATPAAARAWSYGRSTKAAAPPANATVI
jgi:hypothetical protein